MSSPETRVEEIVNSIKVLAAKVGSFGRTWEEFDDLVTAKLTTLSASEYERGREDERKALYLSVQAIIEDEENKGVANFIKRCLDSILLALTPNKK